MLRACSHLVIASGDVVQQTQFMQAFFEIDPHFANKEFADFVLPGGFRIAFFSPVGVAGQFFSSEGERHFASIGVTVADVDAAFERSQLAAFKQQGVRTSGPPKEHPWGEKSFLLWDPDGNRWEVTASPSADGLLNNRG